MMCFGKVSCASAVVPKLVRAVTQIKDLINVLMSLNLFSLVEVLKKAMRPPPYTPDTGVSYMSLPVQTSVANGFSPSAVVQNVSPNVRLSTYPIRVPMEQPDIPPLQPTYVRQPTEHESVPCFSTGITSLNSPSERVSPYPYASLRSLTSGFHESFKIGEGAFGSVFKGQLPSETKEKSGSSRTIAIKRLKMDDNPDLASSIAKQFMEEIDVISQLDHENILPLVGFSCDERELCLVYDFMFNGSLSANLEACREGKKRLTVVQRLEIGRGSAAGIAYLHNRNKVHRDIKSSNILLDGEMKPRISDFGLIRSTKSDKSTSTCTNNPIGTMVYMSPEACKGTVSYAMDVYSFGIVLLELLTGLPVMDESRDPSHLSMYVEERCDEGEDIASFFDQAAGEWTGEVGRSLHSLSEDCLLYKHIKRPTMAQVLNRLEQLCQSEAS